MALATYADRTTQPALPDLESRLRDVTREVASLATALDVWASAAEQAQLEESDRARGAKLEPLIQKLGALSRDLWEFHRKVRRHGMETAARVRALEATIVDTYATKPATAAPER